MIVIFCSHLVGKSKFELENISGADLIFQLLTYFFLQLKGRSEFIEVR
jgi:hypothetical protein